MYFTNLVPFATQRHPATPQRAHISVSPCTNPPRHVDERSSQLRVASKLCGLAGAPRLYAPHIFNVRFTIFPAAADHATALCL